MQKTHKNKHEHQKERKQRQSIQPAGVVELTEQDLEQVQGAQAMGVSGGPAPSSDSPQSHSIISPR